MSFEAGDVVIVPFPFVDKSVQRRRPALVLSRAAALGEVGQSVCAMITSARRSSWPLDVAIGRIEKAGIRTPSIVRMKLFTLDHRLIIRKAGELAPKDWEAVQRSIARLFGG